MHRQTTHLGSPLHLDPEDDRRSRGHYSSPSRVHHSSPVIQKDASAFTIPEDTRKMSGGVSKSGVLAQQIQDEFLTCKICLEGFTNPKSLNCLHTFCEECIENHANSEGAYKKYSDYREFTCPLCRKRTTLPTGGVKKLPDNFLVSSLTEVIDRQKPSKYPFCDICKLVSRKHKDATSKCLDCNKLLCKSCVDQHLETKVTKNHNVFDVEIEAEIECKEHKDEVVRFYCETCATAVCILCTFNDHKDHDVCQFSDAVKQYKENIQNLLVDCKSKLERFDHQIEVVIKCDKCIRSAEQKIKDVSMDMISDIRNREKILIDEIHNMYGAETMALIEKKTEMQSDLEALRSTVQLTELIVKGKDMELLLLKKEIQQKLEILSKSVVDQLPKTASKLITFVPGMVDMGYIHDQDRPLLTSVRRAYTSGSFDYQTDGFGLEFVRTSETQTDSTAMNMPPKSTNTDLKTTTDTAAQTDHWQPPVQIIHQATPGSSDEQSASSQHNQTTLDDDAANQRRRRRRERARTARNDSSRYSYPSETTAGRYESNHISKGNADDGELGRSRRKHRYRAYEEE